MRVGFDKLDPRILPEMSAKVAFRDHTAGGPSASHAAIVPKTAVQQHDGRDVVLVLQNGRVERRAVTVSSSRDDETLISAGVSAGERVVLDWPKGLEDGVAVREGKR